MKNKMSKKIFIVAFALIIGSNIYIFYNSYINKNGESKSVITLTDKELSRSGGYKENSARYLYLIYDIYSGPYNKFYTPRWFTDKKAQELEIKKEKYKYPYKGKYKLYSKDAFIVLEYDGKLYKKNKEEAYKNWLLTKFKDYSNEYARKSQLEDAKSKFNRIKDGSRLYLFDAGLDYNTLVEKYQDQSKYIIVKGKVLFRIAKSTNSTIFYDYSIKLDREAIFLPLELKKKIYVYRKKGLLKDMKYKAKLAYGKNLDPWIESIKVIK